MKIDYDKLEKEVLDEFYNHNVVSIQDHGITDTVAQVAARISVLTVRRHLETEKKSTEVKAKLIIQAEEALKLLNELEEKIDRVSKKGNEILTIYKPLINVGAIQEDIDLEKAAEKIAERITFQLSQEDRG